MELVKKRGCLSLPEVRRLTVQLCGAVKYMHARNVIHRDLKMGNLFLDHDMNLKIGDFGLAAVLVSKSEYEGVFSKNASRRTTVCGTPNYIAPEILEKAKGGHDHKVDIWAIGVILYVTTLLEPSEWIPKLTSNRFAMLTGFPPFQATSQDEIYRKAKNVEYDWPDSGANSRRCHNDIPLEAKGLVSCLLQVDAEARPNPDGIVSHQFFSMHGGNAIPLALDPSCRRQKPSWLLDEQPRGDVMDKITPRLELSVLAQHCGVGQLRGELSPYQVVGDNVDISLYKECIAEDLEGGSPVVPLPDEMVYCSTASLNTWPNRRSPSPDSLASVTLVEGYNIQETTRVSEESEYRLHKPTKPIQVVQPNLRKRGPIQSHAATLRAAQAGPIPLKATLKPTQNLNNHQNSTQRSTSSRRLLNELPVRPGTGPISATVPQGATSQRQSSRVTRSATSTSVPRPNTADRMSESEAPEPDKKRRDDTAKNEARIAATIQEEIEEAMLGQRSSRRLKKGPKMSARRPARESTLISPDEVAESLVGTDPKSVLASLKTLHEELSTCLNGKAQYRGDHKAFLAIREHKPKSRPVVSKWVDYSHKFGVGYMLENGTVGCLLNGEKDKHPSCVAIAHADNHYKKKQSPSYPDKHQIVDKDGAPVAFFENCGEEGFRRVLVSPKNYQISGDRSITEGFRNGTDIYDSRKRERLFLWEKFARYMAVNLARNDSDKSSPDPSELVGPFLKFYQRIGNVGIFGFGDGSLQFNFPDHTKLMLSSDGTWLDYYYLPVESAQSLKRGEILEAASLLERSVLHYPTSIMLKGSYGDHDFKSIIIANELPAKVAFVKDIVAIWCKAGGLGRMTGQRDLKWEGMSEKGGKYVWVTIGAYGGDEKKYERRGS